MSYGSNLKAALDPLYGNRVYRQKAPPRTELPYVTIFDDISRLPMKQGDARTTARRRRHQVNVWERVGQESDELIEQTELACETAQQDSPRTHATVVFSRRLPIDPSTPDISHRVVWVDVAERTVA